MLLCKSLRTRKYLHRSVERCGARVVGMGGVRYESCELRNDGWRGSSENIFVGRRSLRESRQPKVV